VRATYQRQQSHPVIPPKSLAPLDQASGDETQGERYHRDGDHEAGKNNQRRPTVVMLASGRQVRRPRVRHFGRLCEDDEVKIDRYNVGCTRTASYERKDGDTERRAAWSIQPSTWIGAPRIICTQAPASRGKHQKRTGQAPTTEMIVIPVLWTTLSFWRAPCVCNTCHTKGSAGPSDCHSSSSKRVSRPTSTA
jgi:hypothetical protein